MSTILSANRVTALAGFLTGLAALIAAFVGVFPAGWQNAALAAVGLIHQALHALAFLRGSQQWDKLTLTRPVQITPSPDGADANQDGKAAAS